VDLIKRILKIVLPLAIAAVLVNDAGRYFTAMYDLGNVTRDAATASASAAHANQTDRTGSWQAGQKLAEASGATIYGFDIKGEQVFVWSREPVHGTWLLQRVAAMMDSKLATTPLIIEDQSQALIQ
jgi:hypothetical protein